MSNNNEEVIKKLAVICRLLYMQTRPRIEKLKDELKLTKKQKRVYDACNGQFNMKEIARKAKCSLRYVRHLLPEWEKKGLILGFGKGPDKKYVNLENLEV